MGYRRLAHAQTMAPMSQRLRRLVLLKSAPPPLQVIGLPGVGKLGQA